MKKVIVLFIAIITLSISATAQMTLQTYTRINIQSDGKVNVEPDVNIYGQKFLTKNEKVGIWGFALVEKGWAEAYGGLLYSPAKWVEITVGAGIEQCPGLYRLSANVCMFGKGFTFLLATEKGEGADNWWYKSILKYQVKNWNFGVMSWRFHGTGPLVEYAPAKRINIWVNPVRDFEFNETRVVLGVDVKI